MDNIIDNTGPYNLGMRVPNIVIGEGNPYLKTIDNTDTFDLDVRVPEIVIDEENPFLNDKLGRDYDVRTMTKIVEALGNGAVISLNAPWGNGKTTFLKLWKQFLENNGYPVVLYNAWEDDISEEPLFSMIKGLRSLSTDPSGFDKFVEQAGKFIVGGLFGALKAATGFWGTITKETIEGGVSQLEKSCIDSLKSKEDTASLISTFKDALQEYVASTCDKNKPLIYLVDELDRCNPTFAVKVLERIKHLFDIPNIVFVLSVDKEQLCHSINGYFGSEAFDSENYLSRFIDIEYLLPPFDASMYCSHLINHYHFNEMLNKTDCEQLIQFTALCCSAFGFGCRQIEKVFSLFTVSLFCVNYQGIHSDKKAIIKLYNLNLFFYLSAIKTHNSNLFLEIAKGIIPVQELVDEIEKLHKENGNFMTEVFDTDARLVNDYIETISLLLMYYLEHQDNMFSTPSQKNKNYHNVINQLKFNFLPSDILKVKLRKIEECQREKSPASLRKDLPIPEIEIKRDSLFNYVEKLKLVNNNKNPGIVFPHISKMYYKRVQNLNKRNGE